MSPVSALIRLVAVLTAASLLTACRQSNTLGDPDFGGETVRIIVGFAPGGTYDLHARLMATHLGRHLPGEPAVVVENMPGAGGKVAANHLARVARPDGLTIGLLAESNAADAVNSDLLGQLQILVSPGPMIPVMVFSSRSGIKTVEDWRLAKRPPRIASSGPGAPTFVVPRIAGPALGLPMQFVTGYSGSGEMRLAMEGGEVDGICLAMDSFKATLGASSDARVVLRFSNEPIPGIDAPDALSLVTDANARAMLETGVYAMVAMSRFYAIPRDVPAVRASTLRKGLMDALTDGRFLADAHAASLTISPTTAETLEQQLRLLATRPQVLADIRAIISGR